MTTAAEQLLEDLKAHQCLEAVDRVAGDPDTTDFKRRARLHQAKWRVSQGHEIGSQPMRPKPDQVSRALGSRLKIADEAAEYANFLTQAARDAVTARLSNPQPHQTLNTDRLYYDLLSSMPMCFNLFGPLHADLALANRAVHAWWPSVPGRVDKVWFEWSPGRRQPGRFLENASAFDVGFELDLGDGRRGLLGVETKYHEDCRRESIKVDTRRNRYMLVAGQCGAFKTDPSTGTVDDAIGQILDSELRQIALDHLLAMSMPLDDRGAWAWTGFALVYPTNNPSYARATARYKATLNDPDAFLVSTLEQLLDSDVLPADFVARFKARYCW